MVQKRLIRAGYREKTYRQYMLWRQGAGVPILLCLLVTVTGLQSKFGGFSVYVLALGLGFLDSGFLAGQWEQELEARQTRLRLGLPDALDLIIICVEAGLGMDRAILRTAEELQLSHPVIADELGHG